MGRSKPRRRYWPAIDALAAALIACQLAVPPAAAAGVDDTGGVMPLQLEVRINGQAIDFIGAFTVLPDKRLAATRTELTELGLVVPGTGPPEEAIELDRIVGLAYRYDEVKQTVEIEAPDALRLARTFDASSRPEIAAADASNGLVVNYTAFAEGSHNLESSQGAIDGGSLSLDARAFSKAGTLIQSGILGTTAFSDATALRLDTAWSYSDEADMRSYRAGDVIGGGFAWTRPIRMGGIQMHRNFALRPDLITMPLPSVSGSAAVPSTVDVYIDNVRTYSQQVGGGPYRIDNIPVITGSGTARIVVTDATGRETEEEREFITSPDLLRTGLYDYSVEAGVARRNYGKESFDYDDEPVAMAGLRYGIKDDFTAELHGEAGAGIANGGVGGIKAVRRLGIFGAAVAASLSEEGLGGLGYVSWETGFGNLTVGASTRRTLGDYADLASVTEDFFASGGRGGAGVPKALDQISLSYGFPEHNASAGLALIHRQDADGGRSLIASASLLKTFDNDLSVFANGFADFGDTESFGAYVGISIPLGEKVTASAGVTATKDSFAATAQASRSLDGQPGSYGWRVSHGESEAASFTSGSAAYRAAKVTLEARAFQHGGEATAAVSADGAVVVAGGGVFLGNRIDDAFAIVDAGSPDVPVKLENRDAGTTGNNGKLLVTGVNAYRKNKISIDIANLPVMAEIPQTEMWAVPKEKSGVLVDFGIKREAAAAIVIVTDGDGAALPIGTPVTLDGSGEEFITGFDGQVFITGLAAANVISATANTAACKAQFSFAPDGDVQQTIGPVKCI